MARALSAKESGSEVSMLGDGLPGVKRWNYHGGAVHHAAEDRTVCVCRPWVEAVVPGVSQNPPAHDTGGCASYAYGANVNQRSCIIVYVLHAAILELGPSDELLVACECGTW